MKLYVYYTAGCNDSYHDGEQYGEWSEDNYFSVDGVCLADPKGSCDEINVCFEKKDIGDCIYVLVVHYGSGDSFGYSTGNGEIIWAFADSATAHNALAACNKAKSDVMRFDIQDENGNDIPVWNHDYDYFGGVEGYELKALVLEK